MRVSCRNPGADKWVQAVLSDPRRAIRLPGVKAIANSLGDPACFRWTLDRILRTLRENRVEMYREDNNSDPALLWRRLDSLGARTGAASPGADASTRTIACGTRSSPAPVPMAAAALWTPARAAAGGTTWNPCAGAFRSSDEDTGETLEDDGETAAAYGISLRFSRPRQARLLWIGPVPASSCPSIRTASPCPRRLNQR